MTNNGVITIQGKEYMTVARRLELAHDGKVIESVETEVLSHDPVVVRAKVFIKGRPFTGISSVSLDTHRYIEKQNPYEVAETSAVGRALGFAGFGLIESVASADEVARAVSAREASSNSSMNSGQVGGAVTSAKEKTEPGEAPLACEVCGKPAKEKKGTTKGGKPYHGIFCSTEDRTHTRWLWN